MTDSEWRIVLTFDSALDAQTFAEYVNSGAAVSSDAGTLSYSSRDREAFAYAETDEAIQRVAEHLRSAARGLAISPTDAVVSRWLPDESRWTDEPALRTEGETTRKVVGGILGEMFDRL